jgi:hypothetical protein
MARLQNAFPFFGSDMVRPAASSSSRRNGPCHPFGEAAKRVARAGWRAEVHPGGPTFSRRSRLRGGEQGLDHRPALGCRARPFITRTVDRLKALGGLSLTSWRYLAGTAVNNGRPSDDR